MTFRKIIFWTHLIVGLSAGLVIFNSAVTGMILAYEHQIVDLAEKKVQHVSLPEEVTPRLALNELASRLQSVHPGAPLTGVSLNSDPSASISFQRGRGREGSFYVNPYTGMVLGPGSKVHDLMHKIEDWHRWLWSREIGRPITGAACFMFMGLIFSGVFLWIPKQWQWNSIRAIVVFNPTLKGKPRDWNWHNVIGIWSSPFLLVITLTGLVMSYGWANDLLYRLSGNVPPPRPTQQQRMAAPVQNQTPMDFDLYYQTVEKQVPEWNTINIRAGRDANGPVTAAILEKSAAKSFMRSQLTLDAKTAEVIKWEPFEKFNLGRKWRFWIRPLHTGEAFGIFGQTLALIVATGAVVLVWTGFSMAWYRFFGSKKTPIITMPVKSHSKLTVAK